MSLVTWTKIMSFATVTALIYINVQTQIVDLAYKGKSKEKHMHELIDSNGILRHEILTLKSANHLGIELLEKNEGFEFIGHDRVMTLSGPSRVAPIHSLQRSKTKPEIPFWNLISFLSPQEAKAWDH